MQDMLLLIRVDKQSYCMLIRIFVSRREPFPLYPGEVLKQPVAALKVVVANCALRLKSVLDFDDDNGDKRIAGDEWLFEGPGDLSS
jgi:hypothetical protein